MSCPLVRALVHFARGAGRFASLGSSDEVLAWSSSPAVGVDHAPLLQLLYFLHDGSGFRADVAGRCVQLLREFHDALAASHVFATHEVIGR